MKVNVLIAAVFVISGMVLYTYLQSQKQSQRIEEINQERLSLIKRDSLFRVKENAEIKELGERIDSLSGLILKNKSELSRLKNKNDEKIRDYYSSYDTLPEF